MKESYSSNICWSETSGKGGQTSPTTNWVILSNHHEHDSSTWSPQITAIDSFKCHICHVSPIEPPVIFARCCRRILGYQVCADTWYHQDDNMTRTFPMCRAERAYSDTKTLRGLDDLLSNLSNHRTLMGTSHHRDVCSSSPWPLTVQLHMYPFMYILIYSQHFYKVLSSLAVIYLSLTRPY